MSNQLDKPLSTLSGVGYRMSSNLKRLGLETIRDLIYHFPHRYDDFRNGGDVSTIELDTPVTLTGQIWTIKNIFTRNRKRITQALFNDGANTITLVWFNSHWLTNQLHPGDQVRISGKVSRLRSGLQMTMPVWEKVLGESQGIHTGRLVPIYPETTGITSKWLREKVTRVLDEVGMELEETLPDKVRGNKVGLKEAIQEMHFPSDLDSLDQARQRLAFEELFYIQLATLKVRREWQAENLSEPIKIDVKYVDEFVKELKFKLTGAQQRVLNQLVDDLANEKAMNRMVQGDVGSGKTVVAAALMYGLAKSGWRSVLMAPTEVLAIQHVNSLRKWFDELGISVGLQTGSVKIKDEVPDIVVGTHALIAEKFKIDRVGLVVIDEQHRFGVNQRNKLRELAEVPHFLSMTATPIPRTVALTMYGDLDLSIIDEMPVDRKPVKTYLVPQTKRSDAYKFIDRKLEEGDQAYVVVPLIEESEMIDVKAAKTEFENLKKIFVNRRLALLHGKMKSQEKTEVLDEFKSGKCDILVSTSVVEVGVDVPNATIMVIEGAERFGLASLHQLRGRVGRGVKESFCFLFMSEDSQSEISRLKTLTQTNNGLELAELDLKIRGSGEVFGKRQSGRFELKVATLADIELVNEARNMANLILDEDSRLDKYPSFRLKLDELISSPSPD